MQMTSFRVQELRALFDWIVAEARDRWGDELPLDQNFYRAPSLGWLFRDEDESESIGYGSLADEAELHRTSVLGGGEDLLDVVAERVAYILLAIADVAERESE